MTEKSYPDYSATPETAPTKPIQTMAPGKTGRASDRALAKRYLPALNQIKRRAENRRRCPDDFASTAKEILDIIQQSIPFDAGWTIKLNPRNFRFLRVYLRKFSRATFSAYLNAFQTILPTARQLKEKGVVSQRSADLIDKKGLRSSLFYKTVLEPLGLASFLIGACIDSQNRYVGLICLWRSPNRPDFSPSDTRFLAEISGDCAVLLGGNKHPKERPIKTPAIQIRKKRSLPGIFVFGNQNATVFMNEAAQALLTLVQGKDPTPSEEGTELPFFSKLHQVREKIDQRHALLGAERTHPEENGPTSLDHLFTFRGISFSCRGTVLDGGPTQSNLVLVLVEAGEGSEDPLFQSDLHGTEVKDQGKKFGLTDQEEAVARLTSRGLTNKEVASQLGISFHTTRGYLKRVMKKLEVTTRSAITSKMLTQ
jgi:DNA-binding CsgD family transcriptional regulator